MTRHILLDSAPLSLLCLPIKSGEISAIDVILAAQAPALAVPTTEIVVATSNVAHLSRFVPADLWTNIMPQRLRVLGPCRRRPNTLVELAILRLVYEQAPEYPLTCLENRDVPFSWRVEKMRLSKDRTQVVVNPSLTLGGVPAKAYEYRLGNRSALEWVLDKYQVSVDKRSGIITDPNREDDPEYIVRLVGRVVTVSVETYGWWLDCEHSNQPCKK